MYWRITMEFRPHQIDFGDKAYDILKRLGYVYIAGKPRSGKTATALYVTSKSKVATRWLILCPKNAIGTHKQKKKLPKGQREGWMKFIDAAEELGLTHTYTVTNYEQVGKSINGKLKLSLDPKDYDGVIIDESHNLGKLGRPSNRSKLIRMLCYNLPHIHLSGTAIVESPCSIYHQMYISKYNPFPYKNFYDFHRKWGIPYYIKAGGRDINQYDKYKPELLDKIDKFTLYMTQEDAGISKDVQAVDQVHYVKLSDTTKKLYNTLMEDKIAMVDSIGKEIVCDTTMKERTSLHMLESGVGKIDDDYVYIGNTEKIDYIKNTFGDSPSVGIMCHFVPERTLLRKHFKYAEIYSSTSDAEGVDLSHLEHFIVLSSDYRGSKAVQRRERIINMNGGNTTTVHHILVKGAVSEQIYKLTSKKLDFNNKTYTRNTL